MDGGGVGAVCKDQFGAKLVVLEHLRLQEKYDDDTSIALLWLQVFLVLVNTIEQEL